MAEPKFVLPDELLEYLHDGKLLITAQPSAGPHVNATIISILGREQFAQIVSELTSLSRTKRRGMLLSIKSSIREAVMLPGNPSENQDLLDDITLLFGAKVCFKASTDHANLFYVSLLIDPNEELPWEHRGMLSPELIKELDLDARPVIHYS